MRIMTWNIFGASLGDRKARFPVIKETIETYQPDVACIQEAFLPLSRKMLESIEGYHVSYHTNFFPPLSTKGGLATLTKAKPLKVSFHPYHTQGSLFSKQISDRFIGKGFLETVVEDQKIGKATIINTHKVYTYSSAPDQHLEGQSRQLVEHLKNKNPDEGLVVVAGDFNFRRKTRLYPQLQKILHDATLSLRDFHLFNYEQVDYIFLSREHCHRAEYVLVKNRAWRGNYPSDHPGIYVDIEL